jgi:glycosyltransferase involved in cell wall biosynthesis
MGRESVQRALESVRAQTHAVSTTFVVLDDPLREEWVRSILRSNEVLIVTGGRLGGAEARNLGARASEAAFVAFLDDDDWWEPGKTFAQLRALLGQDAAVSFTYTRFHESSGRTRILPTRDFPDSSDLPSYLVQRPRLRHGDGYIQTSSLMISRDLLRSVEWNSDLPKHQDWDFVVRLVANQRSVAPVREVLVNVQQGSSGSISKTRNWEASLVWLDIHANVLSSRAIGDFAATHILRGALAQRNARGVGLGLNLMRVHRPHLSAVIVGLYGSVEGIRLK